MCGIAGAISIDPLAFLADRPRVDRAIDSLAHRGPDDRGQWISDDGRSFLGHRRLSIIDLAGGHQPITDESGRRHFIYNGEIYNFRALRTELLGRNHVFRTHTDGETALHLHEEDPDHFVTRLQGMFAIAILQTSGLQTSPPPSNPPLPRGDKGGWASPSEKGTTPSIRTPSVSEGPLPRLTLARDRNGIKPLYYYFDGQTLIFASELKAILLLLEQTPAVSPHALREYLRWKYVPAPLTIYQNIYELPPGHILHARPDPQTARLALTIRRYWDPNFGDKQTLNEQEAIEELDHRLRAAVECHLESDVEIGALLSGGVDSSLVVALASQISGKRIKTFSVGFREEGFDQLPFARVLAERYNTDHHEIYVDLDPGPTIERLVRQFDQPFADSSALACLRVCEVAARHVKVALTGDGGDETFAGYKRYDDLLHAANHENILRTAWKRTVYAGGSLLFSPEAKFLNRYRAAGRPPLERFEARERMCGDWLMNRLLGEAYRDENGAGAFAVQRDAAAARSWSTVDIAQYVDSRTYLPGDILRKVDRTSMACSLECRVPLLDHTITEFGASLATDLKIRDGVGKYILKRVAERYVPHELLYRKKRGFRIPIRRWFKRGLLDETAELLQHGLLIERGILDPAGLHWVLRNQRRPWMNLSSLLWSLLFMEHWARA